MRPIEILLTRDESETINTAINRTGFTVPANPGSAANQNFILLGYNPDNQFVVVGSTISGTYEGGGAFSGTITDIEKEIGGTNWVVYVDFTLTDSIDPVSQLTITNVTNSGSNGGTIIQMANLTGLEVGQHVSGDASLPPNAVIAGLIPAANAIRLNSRLTADIATGTTLSFNPEQQDHHIEIVPVDQYISPQEIVWEILGGTVTVEGLVGPMTDYVSTGTLTGPVTNGAYSALKFVNSNATDSARVYIVQTGRG